MNFSGKKVAFYTLGCKLNFSETSTIARSFVENGFTKVDFNETPDVFVINTCSVTENADKKCRQLVKKAKKVNPESFIAVIGCYAQLKPEEISNIEGVNMVLGANDKFKLIEHLENNIHSHNKVVLNTKINTVKEFSPSYSAGDRTRSFLKVQDGCDYFCSFCTIPLARGFSRSNTIAETVKVAQEVAQTDVKEVVLTGVNIGDFGKNTGETFFDLIKELDKVEGIERYRISSIEPNLLTNEIIDFVASSDKFMPHFHIPLQSGADKLLEAMRRRYKTDLYNERVETIKNKMPDACIGVDVIVGFPGETDELFEETYRFINELPVSYLHVFTYSERANTTAVRDTKNVVPKHVRAERSKMLHILSDKKKRAFYESQLNKSWKVLWESEENHNEMYGFTDNYVKVKTTYNPQLANTIKEVQLADIDIDGIVKVV
ncbi:MAG TPA: tRNA (N(6)-L-threonylcarbamoyladenosine(37)-C(2))-methylthiotransferase MtaB [Flavobacteriales bacterium]|nr:tRNA (N(6)-L-threonylcarbamoyladenosine(37)-C(2))-methylthiotransferase MtaB [Flavobacteriales bacterium]|tara:strand:+ start:40118 stop:41416 length:1299 start_codon:yes stop_codon:yes gene_type:complete